MITVQHAQTFARYNRWQNAGFIALMADMSTEALTKDRGGFFGSIQGTMNHLLWGDRIWMSRFDDWTPPGCGIPDSPALYPTFAAWRADRERADARMVTWADALRPAELRGTLTWHSGALDREVSRPLALCVTHMFNHQTHHRGQVHAMLTAAGQRPGDTDLFVMPDDVW